VGGKRRIQVRIVRRLGRGVEQSRIVGPVATARVEPVAPAPAAAQIASVRPSECGHIAQAATNKNSGDNEGAIGFTHKGE
jgi:hypothetical protein